MSQARGRYSFIGFEPFAIIEGNGLKTLAKIRQDFQQYFQNSFWGNHKANVPFLSGIVGYWGYDFGLSLEGIESKNKPLLSLPDCRLAFYDHVIAIDHFKRRCHVMATGLSEKKNSARLKRAQADVKNIVRQLGRLESARRPDASVGTARPDKARSLIFKSNFSKNKYLSAVHKALGHIRRGDIYQINLSQQFMWDARKDHVAIDPVDVYEALRKLSPSSFAGYLDCGAFQILSSSPERFVKVKNRIVQTCPMKGTRRRGKNMAEDVHLKNDLLRSTKEKAELLMVTDLERNDLGRVCRFGSVEVRQMRALEKYKTVFQTTATIEGVLRKDKDAFDVIANCFPSGSVTGCPKIRAMQIIDELEPTRRGCYTGAMGFIDARGGMDLGMLIRAIVVKDNRASFHVGGGIVSDSNPEREYEETLIKAQAMKRALEMAL